MANLILNKTAKISSKNQITLPVEILNGINLGKGDYVKLVFDPKKQTVSLIPVANPIASLKGFLKKTNYSTKQFLDDKKLEEKAYNKKHNLKAKS
ncbi:MAG: AbrB/MazE/SpoVT family DNA-binding domain-containing protein [bacterium]